jgi:nitrate/nitrite transport system ATP-binding protein
VGEVLAVDLPRPRDRLALANNPRFLAARAAVLEFLHARHANPALEAA